MTDMTKIDGVEVQAVTPRGHPVFVAARAAMAEANGEQAKAVALLEARLTADPALRVAFAEDAMTRLPKLASCIVTQNARAAIARAYDGPSAAAAHMAAMAYALLDWPLAGGVKLRDAGRKELDAAISDYRKSAATSLHRAAWLQAIRDKVPEQGTVGDVISEDEAKRLYEAAK